MSEQSSVPPAAGAAVVDRTTGPMGLPITRSHTRKKSPAWLFYIQAMWILGLRMLLPLLRRMPWIIAFLVYGTDKDQQALGLDRLRRFLPEYFPIGFIRQGWRFGIMIATMHRDDQINHSPDLARHYIDSVKSDFFRTQAFAVAGRLPGWLVRAGGKLEFPVVSGIFGTRCTVLRAAERAVAIHNLDPKKISIAIVGVGRIGREISEDLVRAGFAEVIAYDKNAPSAHPHSDVFYTQDPNHLSRAHIVIILTGTGNEARDVAIYLKPGTIALDETHPGMQRHVRELFQEQGVILLKVTMGHSAHRMYPDLPNFRRGSVLGCEVEGLVTAISGTHVLQDFDTFCKEAERLGFRSNLYPHLNHS